MNIKTPFRSYWSTQPEVIYTVDELTPTHFKVYWTDEQTQEYCEVSYLKSEVYSHITSGIMVLVNEDPLVEISQSEYDGLIEEINLLQELLAEVLAKNNHQLTIDFKPINYYAVEDWKLAKFEGWGFLTRGGDVVTIDDVIEDDTRPVICSNGWNHSMNGMWDQHTGIDNDDIIRRVK